MKICKFIAEKYNFGNNFCFFFRHSTAWAKNCFADCRQKFDLFVTFSQMYRVYSWYIFVEYPLNSSYMTFLIKGWNNKREITTKICRKTPRKNSKNFAPLARLAAMLGRCARLSWVVWTRYIPAQNLASPLFTMEARTRSIRVAAGHVMPLTCVWEEKRWQKLCKKKNQESENLRIKNTAELTQILVDNPRKMKLFRKTVVSDDFLTKNSRLLMFEIQYENS